MELISLKAVQLLSNRIDDMLHEPPAKQEEYELIIDAIARLEVKVTTNKKEYPDWDKISTLCRLMVFKLTLKITEALELVFNGGQVLQ